jgi:hypothetical protein
VQHRHRARAVGRQLPRSRHRSHTDVAEYPCAHCISAAAVADVLEAEFGPGRVPTIAMTSSTAPGVTHRWERIADYVDEVKQARIWGGVHYRQSTEVGERMGRAIGRLAVEGTLQPVR